MAKKFVELDNKEQGKIKTDISCDLYRLTDTEWDDSVSNRNSLKEDCYGMCATCKSLEYARTEFGVVRSYCTAFDMLIISGRVITECTHYTKTGSLTLNQMYDMAVILELEDEKVAGFIVE